ncbi:mitochondrial ribosomal large subunit component [Quaeritorhiza haematococci]|nr:mitochondrial ribosomal large subunit component [Quaeritorhiza haematococci]
MLAFLRSAVVDSTRSALFTRVPSISASYPPSRLPSNATAFFPISKPHSMPILSTQAVVPHSQTRHNQNLRPRRLKFRKAQKGFFKVPSGGSLRGTSLSFGQYGLAAVEGGRLKASQLENARTGIRRVIKQDKGSKIILRAFPHRPVTAKGSESRMGKGKGAVDYFGTWVKEGSVIFEVRNVRGELAKKAMRVAASVLPIRTKFLEAKPTTTTTTAGATNNETTSAVRPRVLPYFIRKRLAEAEFRAFDSKTQSS